MMKLNKFYLFYVYFAKCKSFYSYPCPSDKLAVYRVSQPSENTTLFHWCQCHRNTCYYQDRITVWLFRYSMGFNRCL